MASRVLRPTGWCAISEVRHGGAGSLGSCSRCGSSRPFCVRFKAV